MVSKCFNIEIIHVPFSKYQCLIAEKQMNRKWNTNEPLMGTEAATVHHWRDDLFSIYISIATFIFFLFHQTYFSRNFDAPLQIGAKSTENFTKSEVLKVKIVYHTTWFFHWMIKFWIYTCTWQLCKFQQPCLDEPRLEKLNM